MIKKIFIIVLLFWQFGLSEDWIDANIELTINCKFNQALSLIEKRIANDSTDFKSHFYLAATLNSKMTHYENFEFEEEFYKAIDKTISLVNSRINNLKISSDSLKAQNLFYLGSAYGYLGYFEGRKGNWYTALSNGLEAIDLLEKSIELDSTLYKSYLGIGTYDYWSSSKIKFALWFPLIPDRRDEGIEIIKKSMLDESPVRFMAMHQLVYILIDYENYDEAQIYAKKIILKYPHSQFMWWAYSHVYYKMRDYEKAIAAYIYLLDLIINDEESNPLHKIKCHLKLAQLYFESSNYVQCIFHCEMIFQDETLKYKLEEIEDEIDEAKEYFEMSQEKMNEM